MQIDVTEVIHNYGWKVLVAAVSLFGTSIFGFYHYFDQQNAAIKSEVLKTQEAVIKGREDDIRTEGKIDAVSAKVDVLIAIVRSKK